MGLERERFGLHIGIMLVEWLMRRMHSLGGYADTIEIWKC